VAFEIEFEDAIAYDFGETSPDMLVVGAQICAGQSWVATVVTDQQLQTLELAIKRVPSSEEVGALRSALIDALPAGWKPEPPRRRTLP
jgi:hypothetical protein